MSSQLQQPSGYQPYRGMTHAETGMLVLLSSFGMLFGGLLLAYGLMRARAPVWPPAGADDISPWIAGFSTFVAFVSSYRVEKGVSAFLARDLKGFRIAWLQSLGLGLLFLMSQSFVLWAFFGQGQKLQSNSFSGMVYTLIIAHGLHVLLGLGFLLKALVAGLKDLRSVGPRTQTPKLSSWLWHFLGLIWTLMFLILVWV